MSDASFENQGFIVTGGTSPLGRAVIARAAERGAHVFFSGPLGSDDACAQIVADAQTGGAGKRVFGIPADLSREQDADRFFEMATNRLPEIHAVISISDDNADTTSGSMIDLSLVDWNRTVSAKLRAAFLVSQRVLQEFIANGNGGRLVFVTNATSAVHLTTQYALRALCRSITKEYGRREITSNVLVDQESFEATAETALFLASDEASFVNGEMVLAAMGGTPNVER